MSNFNKWFCELPEGRQKSLRDDKWALANAAFEHAAAERDSALAQNAELVAQVEYAKSHFYELIEVAQRCDSWESFPQKPIDRAIAALELMPSQRLRDRDAEKGRAGYLACAESFLDSNEDQKVYVEYQADLYAESVKCGEKCAS